ncbi:hypothetical protein AMK17_37740 [Streptomyces sp. CB00072]|nr:hypothetical protein AMK17_37740 [Streptomyces sp. CB00072]
MAGEDREGPAGNHALRGDAMTDETAQRVEEIDMSSIPAGEGEAGQTALRPFPVTEVTPDEVGMVSVRYVEGTPQLVITGGTVIPAVLTAVDGSGDVVAEYTAPRRLARSSSYSILEAGIGMADFEDTAG